MPSSPSYKVSCDPAANVLRIGLNGAVDEKSMSDCVAEIEKCLAGMRPHFKVLTDLSGIQSMDTACIPKVKRVMDLCRSRGVQTVIRVIPDRSKDVGFSILSFFHYSKKVHIQSFQSLSEAEQALAG